MSPPSMSSTVLDTKAPFLPPDGIDDTEVSAAGLVSPPNLGDSPPGRVRKRLVKGAQRNVYLKDLDSNFTREFTKLTTEKKAIRDDKTEKN